MKEVRQKLSQGENHGARKDLVKKEPEPWDRDKGNKNREKGTERASEHKLKRTNWRQEWPSWSTNGEKKKWPKPKPWTYTSQAPANRRSHP